MPLLYLASRLYDYDYFKMLVIVILLLYYVTSEFIETKFQIQIITFLFKFVRSGDLFNKCTLLIIENDKKNNP